MLHGSVGTNFLGAQLVGVDPIAPASFCTVQVLVCATNKCLDASGRTAEAGHSNAASNANLKQPALRLRVMQTEAVGLELRAQPFR